MTTIVLKPFRTNLQRFTTGAPVPAEADLSPFTFDHLKDKRFIGEEKPSKPAKGAPPDPAPAA